MTKEEIVDLQRISGVSDAVMQSATRIAGMDFFENRLIAVLHLYERIERLSVEVEGLKRASGRR